MTSHHVTCHVTAMSRASSLSLKRKEKKNKIFIKLENKRKENKNCPCPECLITVYTGELDRELLTGLSTLYIKGTWSMLSTSSLP